MVCQCEGSWETLWINGCLLNILTGLSSFLWFDLVTYVTGETMTHLTQICRLTRTGFNTGLNYCHELKTRLTGVRTTTTNRKPNTTARHGWEECSLPKFWQVAREYYNYIPGQLKSTVYKIILYICISNFTTEHIASHCIATGFPERSATPIVRNAPGL